MSEKPIKADLMAHMKRQTAFGALELSAFSLLNFLKEHQAVATNKVTFPPQVKSIHDDVIDIYKASPNMQNWLPPLMGVSFPVVETVTTSAVTIANRLPSTEMLRDQSDPAMLYIVGEMERVLKVHMLFGHEPLAQMPDKPVMLDDLAMLLLDTLDEIDRILNTRDMMGIMFSATTGKNARLQQEQRRIQADLVTHVVHLARYPDAPMRRTGTGHLMLERDLLIYTLFIPERITRALRGAETKFADLLLDAYLNARYTPEQREDRDMRTANPKAKWS
jgi:hypothetical protein